MRAYKQGICKRDFIKEIKYHTQMDHLCQLFGYGDTNENKKKFKGCAVGCSVKSITELTGSIKEASDHKYMSESLGIPLWLCKLEDKIFEGLLKEDAVKWPLELSMAIKVGVNLDPLLNKVLIFILKQILECFGNITYRNITNIVLKIISELKKKKPNKENLLKLKNDATDAAYAAAYATDAAVNAAAYATDAYVARQDFYLKLKNEIIRLIKEVK